MHCPTLSELPPAPQSKSGWPWTEETPSLPDTMPDGSPWPLVSIVTPSYNQGVFIEETIRSVLLQGYPNLEYIIIDGGSDDGTLDIIRKYEPWMTYWVSEPDGGQAEAINKGFRMTSGKILAWLNSDDYYFPRAIEIVANTFGNLPELKMLYGDCDIVDRYGNFVERKYTFEFDLKLLRTFDYIWQPAAFFQKDVFNHVGTLDISLHWAMDWDLWLKIGRDDNKISKVNQALAVARVYKENKTESGGERRYLELFNLLRRHRIYNRSLVFYYIQYIAYGAKTMTMRWPLLHKICFEWPKPFLVGVSKTLQRVAGHRI